MEELVISPFLLAAIFFVVAFVYSMVGLGGGSSYTALMAIVGMNFLAIPLISLMLNLFVTTVSSFNYIRRRHARWNLILPFILSSIPMAFVGGSLQLPKEIFYWILLASLVFVALRIYAWDNLSLKIELGQRAQLITSIISGALLGLVAGIVGIGGGVYLVPLIILLGLGTEKEAAACGTIFIWMTSCSGLIARLQYNAIDISNYMPLIVAVLIGGFAGSWLGSSRLSPGIMQKVLGLIILIAIGFLIRKVIFSN